ncbi:MAG: lipase maturation factor family protein [Kofleriaceae bacterium]
MSEIDDVRVPTPWESIVRWFGPPRDYRLTRWMILRLLGVVYLFAFIGLLEQGLPLLGSHGLTPVATFLDRMREQGATVWNLPTIFMWDASDGALQGWAWVGLVISIAVVLGYANLPMLLVLWVIYGSYERVGQTWFGFGWEIQILETTLLCAALAHPWDPRPLAARSPPTTALVLMRWLVFRIMLGAGLIKLRGDACWRELTCLDTHFETQPIPNPLSAWFHHQPHAVHAVGVVLNHVVELVAPWFVFGPRRLRLIAGCSMAAFQIILIISGNLAFLNWLTLVPVLACLDDDFVLRCLPRRVRDWLRARLPATTPRDGRQLALAIPVGLAVILMWSPVTDWMTAAGQVMLGLGLVAFAAASLVMWRRTLERRFAIRLDGHQLAIGVFAALVAIKSGVVVENLASKHQAMNRNYDRLELVNTYGAFGSVGAVRHELVIEGTRDANPDTATWSAYELPCKPGALDRRPCILGPYHLRLDWLIWFAAMNDRLADPWLLHLVFKLLDGDTTIRKLIAVDPFDGAAPTFVRIRRFVYHFGSETWWTRDHEELWLPPISLDEPGLRETLGEYGWPSPSTH